MKVVLTAEAVADLDGIGDYIGRDNPVRAASFIQQLIDKAQDLAEMPERFPLVQRYENFGIRRRTVGKYLILYRIRENRVRILRFVHGARDYEALLFPNE